jgi:hypothetical protein
MTPEHFAYFGLGVAASAAVAVFYALVKGKAPRG